MSDGKIVESGMTFGPYPEGHCFYIEKSLAYLKIIDNVQMAEFLLLKIQKGEPPAIWIVEAKSSTPQPQTQPNFQDFIREIRAKLTNGLELGLALCLKRHATDESYLPVSRRSTWPHVVSG